MYYCLAIAPPPLQLTVKENKEASRAHFRELLSNLGIGYAATTIEAGKISRAIEIAFTRFAQEANNCNSSDVAKLIYEKSKAIIGTSTRMEIMSNGNDQVILDGLLPGAYSNKAILQYAVVNNTPYVFKYPTSIGFRAAICKDFEFCERLKVAAGGSLPLGLVDYQRLCVVKTSGEEVVGSISKVYCFSLNQLTKPLPSSFVARLGHRLVDTLRKVHSLGSVINDVKPGNIFVGVDGSIDIGDFGGATAIGDPLVETTDEYFPVDLKDYHAYPLGDWMCLVNSIFELLSCRKGNSTAEIRKLIAAFDGSQELKELFDVVSSQF